MTCEETKLAMADYWNHAIGEADELAFEAHIAGCDGCRMEAERLGALWKGLALLPVEEPGEKLRGRFYETLGAYRQGVESVPRLGWKQKLLAWWPAQPAWQMAVAAALLMLGMGAGYGLRPSQAPQQVTELREEVAEMRQLVALSLLQQQSVSERLRGVGWAIRAEPSNGEVLSALVSAINHDPSVNVRLAAVDALKPFAQSPQQGVMARRAVLDALAENSSLVQVALIDLLADLKDREATGELRKLASTDSVDAGVKERAQWALGVLQ
jgi:hypothetical protein